MFKFNLSKISHRLTITYAVLFFAALALVSLATLVSIDYYMDLTSTQQLYSVNQVVENVIRSLNDIPKIVSNFSLYLPYG